MSGPHARPGPRPHRRAHLASWAAAAIILLAVGACTSSTTTSTATSAVATASTGPGGHRPTLAGAAADAAQKPAITPADFSIVNQPGANSYPISGYSWALVYTRQQNQATGQALVTMLDWLTHDGQADAAANGYVPLPPQIRQLARTTLLQITGPTGTHLLG